MADTAETLSYRRIFWFWVPLAAMWFMMPVEQPLIAAFIGRMPDPELNLAAYGVVMSVNASVAWVVMPMVTTSPSRSGCPSRREAIRAALIRWTQYVHFSITPRARTVTSGFRCMLNSRARLYFLSELLNQFKRRTL